MESSLPRRTVNQLNKTGAEFFRRDIDLALTFTRIASQAGRSSDKRQRNQKKAREAYETVLRLMGHATLTERDAREIKEKLSLLKNELEKIGEEF